MEKSTISRNSMVNQLLKIGHGDLNSYIPVGLQSVKEEPELFAHLIAWNEKKGEIRDSKVALPIIALRGDYDVELSENAIAHLCLLDPRNLVKAIEFNRAMKKSHPIASGNGNFLESSIRQYITIREENPGWWVRSVLQHRKSMKALYALYHIKPNQLAQDVLFDRKKPKGSVFEALANLKNMNPLEAAGTILHHKIPFLIAVGAVGGIKNNPDIVMALIEQTSGNELINSVGLFQRSGVFDNPALKAAFDNAVERAKKDKRVSTLKAGKAAEKSGDEKVIKKMKQVQEEKLEQLGGIEGDWLVLGDRSSSMRKSIELAVNISSLIAQQVKGSVYLVFFNSSPTKYDVTGKTLAEIKEMTKRISANGMTSIGCGLEMLREQNIVVNGIAICSDGGDNTSPLFDQAYQKYIKSMEVEPTVYHYWVPGDPNRLIYPYIQKFDASNIDYYSLPNLIKTMRANKYSLIDEIMNMPLLKLNDVFQTKEKYSERKAA
jgi:hypothetical protein